MLRKEKNKNNDKDHTTENVFLNTGTPSDSNLRIDEDILKQMSTEENALLPEAVDTQKKSTVPLN